MSRKDTIPVISTEDPSVGAFIDADASIPDGYELPVERTISDPQSPATTLAWLTRDQLCAIASESGVENGNGYATKELLVDAILRAKGLIVYDDGAPLGATSGQATLDGGNVTVSTNAVTADSVIVLTAMDAPDGRLYVGNVTAGTSFQISSTDVADDVRVSWLLI
jgi:hypothetical protein